jgi:hypothetical protein
MGPVISLLSSSSNDRTEIIDLTIDDVKEVRRSPRLSKKRDTSPVRYNVKRSKRTDSGEYDDFESSEKTKINGALAKLIRKYYPKGVNTLVLDGEQMRSSTAILSKDFMKPKQIFVAEIALGSWLAQKSKVENLHIPEENHYCGTADEMIHNLYEQKIVLGSAYLDFTCSIKGKSDVNRMQIDFRSPEGLKNNGRDAINVKRQNLPLLTVWHLLANNKTPIFILALTFSTRIKCVAGIAKKGEINHTMYVSMLEPIFAKAGYDIQKEYINSNYKRQERSTSMWHAKFVLRYNPIGAKQLPFFRTPSTGKLFGLPEGFDTM